MCRKPCIHGGTICKPPNKCFKTSFYIRKSSLQTWNILSADILSAMFLNILSAMDWYLPIFYPGIGVYVNILSASPSRYIDFLYAHVSIDRLPLGYMHYFLFNVEYGGFATLLYIL